MTDLNLHSTIANSLNSQSTVRIKKKVYTFLKSPQLNFTKYFQEICDPASQNQQKVAWPSFVLWLEIGDQGQHG